MGGRYKHNQLLEDLRHLQESLAQEKKSWAVEKASMEEDMEVKKKELAKIQVLPQKMSFHSVSIGHHCIVY